MQASFLHPFSQEVKGTDTLPGTIVFAVFWAVLVANPLLPTPFSEPLTLLGGLLAGGQFLSSARAGRTCAHPMRMPNPRHRNWKRTMLQTIKRIYRVLGLQCGSTGPNLIHPHPPRKREEGHIKSCRGRLKTHTDTHPSHRIPPGTKPIHK